MRVLAVACLWALSFAGVAAESHGVRMADTVSVAGAPLRLNGLGVRSKTFLKIKVYAVGLYLESVSTSPEAILAADRARRIELRIIHDSPRHKLHEEFREGFRRNSQEKPGALQERLTRFLEGVPDLREGQTLVITYVPGEGTTVTGTGSNTVTVPGKDFADAVLRVWLGADPLDVDLKRAMLGNR